MTRYAGYLWALARDDRPFGGTDPPGVVFRYAPGRGGMHAEEMLVGFDGVLQVDGFAGYNRLQRAGRQGGSALRLAYCWSHGRREVIKAITEAGSPVGDEILQRIAGLYVIEKQIRGTSPEQRRADRQQRAKLRLRRNRPLSADLPPKPPQSFATKAVVQVQYGPGARLSCQSLARASEVS